MMPFTTHNSAFDEESSFRTVFISFLFVSLSLYLSVSLWLLCFYVSICHQFRGQSVCQEEHTDNIDNDRPTDNDWHERHEKRMVIKIAKKDERRNDGSSVTRWLDYFFEYLAFYTKENFPNSKFLPSVGFRFCQIANKPSTNCRKHFKLSQGGEVSPNLVTLDGSSSSTAPHKTFLLFLSFFLSLSV